MPSHDFSLVPKFVETHPMFDVQHRAAPAGEWTTIASSLSKRTYSLAQEEAGTWNYRVRTPTVVPAHLLEPEEVIVSPWSEASTAVSVIAGAVNGKLLVKAGQAVELASTAKVSRQLGWNPAVHLTSRGHRSQGRSEPTRQGCSRICGASITGPVEAINGSGSVVIGEGTAECPASTITGPVTVKGNTGGVSIDGNVVAGPLTVTGNSGGTTVTNNKVHGPLTVTSNTGTVVDKPNEVEGPSKLQ